MSPHALVQEYLNLTEHLYAIVTNGFLFRLLRDSTRLVKLSYLEINLEQIMEEGIFSDFAAFYRILHATRMPVNQETVAESLIESYHQDALESGARIRDRLSSAVEDSIVTFANGFLSHPDNDDLRTAIREHQIDAQTFYQYQLRLIYRLLFLMVIEERNLVFPKAADKIKRNIYYQYYSVDRLRRLSAKRYLADPKHKDLWIALKHTFRLFEEQKYGAPLGIAPLAGELFNTLTFGMLHNASLDNKCLLGCLNRLSTFRNPINNQIMTINYAALNVEEFGSVYEGLLEYEPQIIDDGRYLQFGFSKGNERAASGTHYTPDELVTPLIKHSLEHVIQNKIQTATNLHKQSPDSDLRAFKESQILSITVCDVACGSGHILLNAARRIAMELAYVRTGEEQPSPQALREAVRDVIRNCIFGVDINPLAVELCKVAMWLEAHNPNEPLNFLDHRIKCGNAIMGLVGQEELKNGIATEAFKTLPGDEKETAAKLRKQNKDEIKDREQKKIGLDQKVGQNLSAALKHFGKILAMPERTPQEIAAKQEAYERFQDSRELYNLKILADIQVAQFFLPKTMENFRSATTDEYYWRYLRGEQPLQGQAVGAAMALAVQKKIFHWFLEFPKVMADGGFDCIVGNPPYLGGQALSGTFGNNFCEWTRYAFAPAKGCDLVTFFLRRNYQVTKQGGFNAIITTNSIIDGKTREGGLDVILKDLYGSINLAVRSTRWPGTANLYVSLLGVVKGKWVGARELDGRKVDYISAFFEDYVDLGDPLPLEQNKDQMFQGSIFLGDGFLLSYGERDGLIAADPKNDEVIFPVINGQELNNDPLQQPGRCIINFFDWGIEKAAEYTDPFSRVLEKVKPVRDKVKRKSNRERWWIYAEHRPGLYSALRKKEYCFALARTTKFLSFSKMPNNFIYTDALFVYVTDSFAKFSVVQSSVHNEWARKYSGSLETRLRYSPSDCFVTFPFPQKVPESLTTILEEYGQNYHDFRSTLMKNLQLGLTKIYNQFHNANLRRLTEIEIETIKAIKAKAFDKMFGKETANLWRHLTKADGSTSFNQAVDKILELRKLHQSLDQLVLQAYGWHEASDDGPAINLAHDFYEVDYLPENDRVRFTISPEARKEILKRLLLLNNKIHSEEKKAGTNKKKQSRRKKKQDDRQMGFGF